MGFGTNSYVLVQTAPGDEEGKFDVVRVLASTEDIAQKLYVSADYSPTFLGNSQVTSHWHVFSGRRFKRSAVLMEIRLCPWTFNGPKHLPAKFRALWLTELPGVF